MPSAVRALLASTGATVVMVGGGVTLAEPDGDSSSPAATPSTTTPPAPATSEAPGTPLGEVETRGLAVLRAPFCDGVGEEAVVAALGTGPTAADEYGNGERAALAPGLTDVAHEHGCTWSAGSATARGWVFVPPVTAARARALARSAAAAPGCRPLPGAVGFGSPGAALLCRDGGVREASYRGLLGDAWLTCTLSLPATVARADLVDRTGRWCSAVVTAATGATTPR